MGKPRHIELGEKKLATSGLTLDDANILGIECLTGEEIVKLHTRFMRLCGIKFNYFDTKGAPAIDHPHGDPFFRLRFTEKPKDFDALSDNLPRYLQMPNTLPVAYFPRNVDWTPITDDSDVPLILTEGELKAAKACKEGFPTVGIGGVYNWRSLKMGVVWLPSLDEINWKRRFVYIIFDPDFLRNVQVCMALHDIAIQLQEKGAYPYLVTLPELPGMDKTGLDDFLTYAGGDTRQQLRDLLGAAEPLGLSEPMWRLNDRFIYVANPGMIIDQVTSYKIAPAAFKEHHQSTLTYQERVLKPNGTISYKAVSAAATWLKWPLRREAEGMTYRPGEKRLVRVPGQTGTYYNTWPGWGCEPKEGDVTPFLTLLDHLFTGADEGAKDWFIKWLAYPLQHPGTKMFTAAVLWGVRHGTGKSMIGYTMGKIYGKNFTEISARDLHGSHNEWAEGRQFILGDDVAGSDKRQHADALKKMITESEIRVNPKFISAYTIPDCINYFFTSNHPDPFFLEDDDRRFAIFEVIVGPLAAKFYTDYMNWLRNGGAEAVFYYLKHIDLGDFNPAAPAIQTTAKHRMIVNNKSDIASWVQQLLDTPDTILKQGEMPITRDLFTSKELVLMYDPLGRTKVTANGVGRELSKMNIRQVCNGHPLKLPDGSQGRYYPVRNIERWLEATPGQATNHIVEWMQRQGERGRKY